MAIRIESITRDAQGLPVVTWIEDRDMFAPGGGGRERISCFIRPDKDGVLQFVAAGTRRHGAEEEARPWQKLAGFEVVEAGRLYRTPLFKALIDALTKKNPMTGAALTDGAFVTVALFSEEKRGLDIPIHINCAIATSAEANELYALLRREFIDEREPILGEVNFDGRYVWPVRKQPFTAYKHEKLPAAPWWHEWAANGIVAAILGGLAALGFWWLVVR
jgi:hypothetical protein